MGLQTQYLLTGKYYFSPLMYFLFSSTLFLYAIHRIVGLKKVSPFKDQGRYLVISTFKHHIIFYAVISVLVAVYMYWQLSWSLKLSVVIPAIISLAYVIPFLAGKKRLRDLNHIKIFLIMLSWAWITVILPAQELDMPIGPAIILMTFERAFFIFAITLPFDIRDLQIDAHSKVKTIPSVIGQSKAIWFALCCVLLTFLLVGLNFRIGTYSTLQFLALAISLLLTALLIWFSNKERHDYYYTGLMDGTMVLQAGLVFLSAYGK